ncbi:SLBB domain-containing protein [Litoribacter alkaliphilus]|uniref:SLBB domain-containing protein n=1 Tax=Litoribacter ruber TaxID=702568 RepID=A0AAP2CKY6_9BACT|nr:SLBB domain-containing protein [Litoribacter alkaliphilus]MBS9525684.1 SLBB domain-containing protein [Litoribacter alkaliphilus]
MKQLSLFLLFFLVSVIAYAQSLQDIQNVKVDNLSDAQIEQLIKRAEQQGISEQQIPQMAQERGMPPQEVSKLRQRIQELRSGRRGDQAQQQRGDRRMQGRDSRTVEGEVDELEAIFDSLRRSDPYYDLTPKQKKIFGYTLFHNRELTFNPSMNIPTPQNYTIGAGDQLLIDVYGASQQEYDLTVNPEGRVFIPNVGPVQVGGLSVEAATSRLTNSLSNIYSGLRGSNPNTFLQIRLGNIRTIKVSMVGELRKPGTYTLPSFASVFNGLFAAGGPNENGSFRHVQVYRDSKMIGEVDIYDFLVRGGQDSNIMLRDNDVVIVQPVRRRVEIDGPVRRPGLFEIKPDESLEDLIEFAGGFSDRAFQNRVTVRRSTGSEMQVDDIGSDFYATFTPRDGDVYKVGEILERYENRVQVSGAVFRPGEFALTEGLTLKDLIEKAGGLRGDAFTNRATLYRTKENFRQEILSIDLEHVMDGSIGDVTLRREDILNVASIYDIKEEYYVQVSGEVNRTGVYQYADNMTVGDLVVKSRGFKESATNSFIEIARRVKNDPTGKIAEIITIEIDKDLNVRPEDAGITLEPFDHVFIRKSPGFQREKVVKVEGEVLYPGDFALGKTDERISDVLKRAGGMNQFAYPKGATLIRRTEFYKTLEEEERKLKNLQSLLDHIDRGDNVDNSETEMELLKRLEKRVEVLREERDKRREEEKDANLGFIEDRYAALDGADTSSVKLTIRETELVGIELEKIIQNPRSKYDLILQEGDVLSIPKELQTVRMRGEVLYPTTARYDNNRSFRNYISRAGGYTESSRRSRAYVVYANGDVQRTRSFLGLKFYPNIEPGAEIIVPEKPERPPMPPQAWVAIGTGLATMALVVTQVLNNLN